MPTCPNISKLASRLSNPYAIGADYDTGHNHADDVGYLETVKQNRCKQDDYQYDEEYHYRVGDKRGYGGDPAHMCGVLR